MLVLSLPQFGGLEWRSGGQWLLQELGVTRRPQIQSNHWEGGRTLRQAHICLNTTIHCCPGKTLVPFPCSTKRRPLAANRHLSHKSQLLRVENRSNFLSLAELPVCCRQAATNHETSLARQRPASSGHQTKQRGNLSLHHGGC